MRRTGRARQPLPTEGMAGGGGELAHGGGDSGGFQLQRGTWRSERKVLSRGLGLRRWVFKNGRV